MEAKVVPNCTNLCISRWSLFLVVNCFSPSSEGRRYELVATITHHRRDTTLRMHAIQVASGCIMMIRLLHLFVKVRCCTTRRMFSSTNNCSSYCTCILLESLVIQMQYSNDYS